jgi:nucleoside-diphosphate-sugar epimerase
VCKELLAAKHSVLALVRSEASADKLRKSVPGVELHKGSLEDLESLKAGAAQCDGVAHLAFIHDFSALEASGKADKAAIEAMGDVLAGTGRPLVISSGLVAGTEFVETTEDDVAVVGGPGSHRIPSEHAAIALAARGVRTGVVRLPPSVHGDGDHGFVPMLINIAREKGVSAYIGTGDSRWPAVHRDDAARVYRLALEKGAAGATYDAIGDKGIPSRDIATAIGEGLGVPVVSKAPGADAGAHFGWLANFFGRDRLASAAKTRAALGWEPTCIGLLEDLRKPGSPYFAKTA